MEETQGSNHFDLASNLIPVHCITPFCSDALVSSPNLFPPRYGRSDGRSRDYYITTKISRIDRLPNFLSNGAPLAGFARRLRYHCIFRMKIKNRYNMQLRWLSPFYSCVLSDLAFEWKRGWSWPCFDTNPPAFHYGLHVKNRKVYQN